MTLRTKLLIAQAPLVTALVLIAVAGSVFTTRLGRSSRLILADNYRSVLASQRMKESIERIDSAALFLIAGRREQALELARVHRGRFEEELRVQEGNITEVGEREATERLRGRWLQYLETLDRYQRIPRGDTLQDVYFNELLPSFTAVKDAAEVVLSMNQDAMVRKSDQAKSAADRSRAGLIAVSILGCVLAIFASTSLTNRLLRPLSVLVQATRRIAEGDLAARAMIEGKDELARLANEFNTMAERIQKYRHSSLGELLEAQQASQATIDSLADPVLVLGSGGDLRHMNHAAESLLRVSIDKGLPALDPVMRQAVERVHRHVAEGKGPFAPKGLNEAVRFQTTEGERYFLPRSTPVYAPEGDVVGTAVVLQDVTRLLRFEELRTNLVSTVAHELRTPLTSLRMAIHLLTEQTVGPLTEKQADLVYAAREDCERLLSIVDELLDLSRIQADLIELRKSPIEVESAVKSALEAQRASASQRQVRLRNEVLPGMEWVVADPDRLQLVLANLLTNAIRHSSVGGTVTLRAASSNGWIRFEVIDEGPGIESDYQQVIFEKYFQMPGAATGGAGIGLFIAKQVVQAHNGEIGVDSEPGRGATFWFKLPAATERS